MRSENFPWLPDPVLMTADHNHYQTLEQILYGQLDTTDKDIRPSASNRTVAAVAEELQVFFFRYTFIINFINQSDRFLLQNIYQS